MDTEYRICLRMYNELHQGPLLPGKRMFKRLEIRHIDIDFMLIPPVSRSDQPCRSLAEHRRWNVGVVDRPKFVEQRIGYRHPFFESHWCQLTGRSRRRSHRSRHRRLETLIDLTAPA